MGSQTHTIIADEGWCYFRPGVPTVIAVIGSHVIVTSALSFFFNLTPVARTRTNLTGMPQTLCRCGNTKTRLLYHGPVIRRLWDARATVAPGLTWILAYKKGCRSNRTSLKTPHRCSGRTDLPTVSLAALYIAGFAIITVTIGTHIFSVKHVLSVTCRFCFMLFSP